MTKRDKSWGNSVDFKRKTTKKSKRRLADDALLRARLFSGGMTVHVG
jgi:hypothetical protein